MYIFMNQVFVYFTVGGMEQLFYAVLSLLVLT